MLANKQGEQSFKTVLLIHSYSSDYEWTAGVDEGIIKALEENFGKNGNWKVSRIYLDSKRIVEPTEVQKNLEKAKATILAVKPDAVILTDDFAFKHLFRFLRDLKIPVSFAGINGSLGRVWDTFLKKKELQAH